MKHAPTASLIRDIQQSFLSIPLWTRLWMAVILLPMNLASLFFLNEPLGLWIAFLSISALLPSIPIMVRERGFTKAVALPHVLPWLLLIGLILLGRPMGSELYNAYLWLLLLTNLVSLSFDIPDSLEWLRSREKK